MYVKIPNEKHELIQNATADELERRFAKPTEKGKAMKSSNRRAVEKLKQTRSLKSSTSRRSFVPPRGSGNWKRMVAKTLLQRS